MARNEVRWRLRASRLAGWSLALVPVLGAAQTGIFGQGASGLNPFAATPNPEGRSYTVSPGLRAAIVASDNLDLRPPGEEASGQRFELMPYVSGTLNGARASGAGYVAVRGQYRNGGTEDETTDVRTTLFSWGNLRLVDDLAGIYARANVTDVNVSPFGPTSFIPSVQGINRTQFRDFEVSPYLYGRFQGDGTWLARYGLGYTDPGAGFRSSVVQSGFATARSDLTLHRVGVSARGQVYSVGFEDGFDYRGSELDLLGWYRFHPTFRAGAGIGYASNDALVQADGRTSGWGPSAAVEWNPDSRTSLQGRWSDRYYGNSGALQARHRASQWTFGLNYARGITAGTTGNLYGVNSASLFSASVPGGSPGTGTLSPVGQGLVTQNMLPIAGSSFGSGLINSPLVFAENMIGSIGWSRQLDAVLATVFVNNRRTVVTFPGVVPSDFDQQGGTMSYRRRLDTRSALTLTAAQTRTVENIGTARSTLSAVNLTFDHRLGPGLLGLVGGRLQRQEGTGGAFSYDEAAVYAWLDYRF